jgi:hypothetical protein
MAYSVFKEVLDAEMNSIGIKSKKPHVVYATRHQTGTRISLEADRKRKAMPSGKRVSKNGKIYYESRRNRADLAGLGI